MPKQPPIHYHLLDTINAFRAANYAPPAAIFLKSKQQGIFFMQDMMPYLTSENSSMPSRKLLRVGTLDPTYYQFVMFEGVMVCWPDR